MSETNSTQEQLERLLKELDEHERASVENETKLEELIQTYINKKSEVITQRIVGS
jgi:hypothetical protein